MKSSSQLFSESYAYFKEKLPLFFRVYLIPGILAIAYGYFFSTQEYAEETDMWEMYLSLGYLISTFIYLLVFMLSSIAITYVIVRPDITSVKEHYRNALRMFLPYLFVSLLTGLVVTLGIIALIIPGIIFAVWFSVAYIVLIVENKRGTDALRASRAYVKGRGVEVFFKLCFITLVTILLSIPLMFLPFLGMPDIIQLGIGEIFNFLILTLTSIFMYRLYEELKRLATTSSEITTSEETANPSETSHADTEEAVKPA